MTHFETTPCSRERRATCGGCASPFFIATGSFFLGQQDVMPQAVRGSPILFVLALAPLALMLMWLVRVRFSKMISGLKLLDAATASLPRPDGMSESWVITNWTGRSVLR